MITNTNGNKRKVNGDVVGTTPGDVIEFTLLRSSWDYKKHIRIFIPLTWDMGTLNHGKQW